MSTADWKTKMSTFLDLIKTGKTGRVNAVVQMALKEKTMNIQSCELCYGSGKIRNKDCPLCSVPKVQGERPKERLDRRKPAEKDQTSK